MVLILSCKIFHVLNFFLLQEYTFIYLLIFCFIDLLRQQEELRRLEEMKTEKMRRRQEFDYRYVLYPQI